MHSSVVFSIVTVLCKHHHYCACTINLHKGVLYCHSVSYYFCRASMLLHAHLVHCSHRCREAPSAIYHIFLIHFLCYGHLGYLQTPPPTNASVNILVPARLWAGVRIALLEGTGYRRSDHLIPPSTTGWFSRITAAIHTSIAVPISPRARSIISFLLSALLASIKGYILVLPHFSIPLTLYVSSYAD